MTKPGPRAEKPKLPSGDGTGGFVPVAEIYIAQHAELISAPSGEENYPPEAKRLGIEGVVRVKLGIDEHGIVVYAKLVERAGHGFDEAALQGDEAGQVQAGPHKRRPGGPGQHHLELPLRVRSLGRASSATLKPGVGGADIGGGDGGGDGGAMAAVDER